MTRFPDFGLTDQVALVTGASRGLGRAIALSLANAGADVALGLHDPTSAGTLVDEIEALGRRALPVPMDVRDLRQIETAVERVVAAFGRLDILVNNAGLG
ncbi:MAG TPA: SDR family NAD(P)-dependent oxidoreductase, partial [Candidatus Limnocylindrales bacterium]|nr:SDR family NAD(P)-dependent oxidoreductase [Candidatus Limnocylindrales bacterium]